MEALALHTMEAGARRLKVTPEEELHESLSVTDTLIPFFNQFYW